MNLGEPSYQNIPKNVHGLFGFVNEHSSDKLLQQSQTSPDENTICSHHQAEGEHLIVLATHQASAMQYDLRFSSIKKM